MAIHANRDKVQSAIASREDFKNGASLYGKSVDDHGSGRMYPDSREAFYADLTAARAKGLKTYVVASYGTPIGWHVEGTGWNIPDDKYSATTTNHQSNLRMGARA